MKFITKTVPQLKKGDIVLNYGGRFECLEDAHAVPPGHGFGQVGPIDCAVSAAICLSGEVEGYFQPGSDWIFQGNQLAHFSVEIRVSEV